MATALIREIRQRISKLPIKYLIFSHSHLDHILGACAFLKENPAIIIIAQQKAAEHISLMGKDEQESWEVVIKQKSNEAKALAETAKTVEQKNYFIQTSRELDAYYRDVQSSKIVTPNLAFGDSLTLDDKGLLVKLIFLGAGHTPGDIVVFIPADKVLITGDLVHDFEPLFPDSDPDSWIQVLEKIKQINFDYFVGGHGDKHAGREIVKNWSAYMQELIAITREAIREGQTLENFEKQLTADRFASLQNGYGQRIQQFRSGYMEYWTGPLDDAIKGEVASLWKFYNRTENTSQ
jgi:glyoxylase-like metal-dependent hydrolase (beta-lactamase superfamily II)